MAVYRYFDVKKYVKIKFEKRYIVILMIVYIFCCMLYYINNIYLNILNCVVITIYSIIINFKFMKGIIQTIKNGINKIKKR